MRTEADDNAAAQLKVRGTRPAGAAPDVHEEGHHRGVSRHEAHHGIWRQVHALNDNAPSPELGPTGTDVRALNSQADDLCIERSEVPW